MSQIQRRRKKKRLTQGELARRLGVSEITVRAWESGLRTPRLQRIKAIAKALGCRAGDLL